MLWLCTYRQATWCTIGCKNSSSVSDRARLVDRLHQLVATTLQPSLDSVGKGGGLHELRARRIHLFETYQLVLFCTGNSQVAKGVGRFP